MTGSNSWPWWVDSLPPVCFTDKTVLGILPHHHVDAQYQVRHWRPYDPAQ